MGNLLDAPSGAVEIRRKPKKNPRLKISRGFERDTKKSARITPRRAESTEEY